MLDLQVVRASLKAYKTASSALEHAESPSPLTLLSPTTAYLRLLIRHEKPSPNDVSWQDTRFCVLLIEQRAFELVRDRAQYEHDPDASADQRVSRAVTEAFVAAQVEDTMNNLDRHLAGAETAVIRDLLQLVRLQLLYLLLL